MITFTQTELNNLKLWMQIQIQSLDISTSQSQPTLQYLYRLSKDDRFANNSQSPNRKLLNQIINMIIQKYHIKSSSEIMNQTNWAELKWQLPSQILKMMEQNPLLEWKTKPIILNVITMI